MKFECVTEKIQYAVNQTYRVTGKNLSLPILETILIQAEQNALLVKATNLEVGVEVRIPARVHTTGEVAISGSVFAAFLSSLSHDHSITCEIIDNQLVCVTDGNTTKLKIHATDEYPHIPHLTNKPVLSLDTHTLCDSLRSVVFSASTSSMKPELASVYMYIDETQSLVCVATDSFRLAEKRITLSKKDDVSAFEATLLPAKNVSDIVRILENSGSTTDIYTDTSQIAFSSGDVYITSRTVEGTFPDYHKIIPTSFTTEATVLKDDLFHALKISNVFSNTLKQIVVHVIPEQKHFTLATYNSDVGETTNTIEAVCEGDEVRSTFNAKYITDSAPVLSTDSVVLQCNDGNKPMVIRPVSDPSFTYLVMPMNV